MAIRAKDHINDLIDSEAAIPDAGIAYVRDVLVSSARVGKVDTSDTIVCHDILSITKVVNEKFNTPLYRIGR